MTADQIDRLDEARCEVVKLAGVIAGEALEHLAALAGNPQDGAAAIFRVGGALKETLALGPVDQLHDAVVLELKTGGGVGDGYGGPGRGAGNLQKQLMLLGLQTGLECR